MATSIRWSLVGGLLAVIFILGWRANDWRTKAHQAEGYRLELRNEMQRRVASDAKRLTLQRQLDAAQAQVIERVKVVKQTVTKYVERKPECDLNDAVALRLQQLRQGNDVPAAPDGLVDAGSATSDAR
jgi:hypothetical protein